MDSEIEFLGYLAFKGLEDNHRIEFDEGMLGKAMHDLDQNRSKAKRLPMQLIHWLKGTSFLHTSDTDLGTNPRNFQGTWYFLHLTFQEYFAATWLTRHLQADDGEETSMLMMTPEVTKEFVLKEKYNPRYEIVWWMVAGQLEGETLVSFFNLLQEPPVDLIGGYHHRLLAACLKEGWNQLERQRVEGLETQLTQWLQLEMKINNDSKNGSILGSMSYFPEDLLIGSFGQPGASQDYLIRTLEMRTSLTQSAVEILLEVLQGNEGPKEIAVRALRKQSTLPESALQALIGALQDNEDVRRSAAEVLGKQSTLPESALQALIDALQDEDQN
ncbi:hypothetical protein BGX21_006788, partial [Mortierella sp. AD011]